MIGDAKISECGRYRYRLTREWIGGEGTCAFVMLNPSTADALQDDPTIRRCIGFAQDWGFHRLLIVNLFALRATDPKELYAAENPVGLENPREFRGLRHRAQRIVCAWGNHGAYKRQDRVVYDWIGAADPVCFGLTRKEQPKHPLYLRKDAELVDY